MGVQKKIIWVNLQIIKVVWQSCHMVKIVKANLSYSKSYNGKLVRKKKAKDV